MEREELLHDDVFILRAEAFAVSVSARTYAASLEGEEKGLPTTAFRFAPKFIASAEKGGPPVGMEDILDELHDGFDVAEDLRLGGPKRQRGLRSPQDRGVGELGRRREHRGWGLAGCGRPGEEPTAGRRRGPRRETERAEDGERGRGAREWEGGGHAARGGGIGDCESVSVVRQLRGGWIGWRTTG